MAWTITINAVDRTDFIEFGSLKITQRITRKRDSCFFNIRSHDGRTLTPVLGQEVIVTDGSTKVFGGIITALNNTSQAYKITRWKVECQDYVRLFDHKLVPDTFENQTVDSIIASLDTLYFPADFTRNNVDAPVLLDYVAFNYKPLSKCLEELADIIGYDWYIDYDKDLHFFSKEENAAPFNLADNDGSFRYNSLVIRRDNSQVRNSVVVRGGEYLGARFTAEIEANGVDFVFRVPYRFSEFAATLTGNVLDVGVDFLNDADDHDALYGFTEKVLRFKETDIPSDLAVLKVSGLPHLPVIIKLKSQPDIDAMVSAEGGDGIYEFLIVDKGINSRDGARQRALAELESYAATLSEGEFDTETAGLAAGQQITINSVSRGISDEKFIINKLKITMFSNDTLLYSASVVSTKTFDLVDVLQKLILAETKQIEINPDEIVDLIEAATEEMTISEVLVSSLEHNLQAETMTLSETFTPQSLDFETEFVAGPQVPTGFKRVFIAGGSRVG